MNYDIICSVRNGSSAVLHPAIFVIISWPINSFLLLQTNKSASRTFCWHYQWTFFL